VNIQPQIYNTDLDALRERIADMLLAKDGFSATQRTVPLAIR
jgi:hypothetical protein